MADSVKKRVVPAVPIPSALDCAEEVPTHGEVAGTKPCVNKLVKFPAAVISPRACEGTQEMMREMSAQDQPHTNWRRGSSSGSRKRSIRGSGSSSPRSSSSVVRSNHGTVHTNTGLFRDVHQQTARWVSAADVRACARVRAVVAGTMVEVVGTMGCLLVLGVC